MAIDEREMYFPEAEPLIGWRLFRVRRSEEGLLLSAPLIHDPDFERFPSRRIDAVCYEHDHPAPSPGCRCGLYAAIEGTLDSLSGYLNDSAHDGDLVVYGEVACTGRVFLDARGVRAQRIDIRRLAVPAYALQSTEAELQVKATLRSRYRVDVCDLDVLPEWLVSNASARGAPDTVHTVDLDALEAGIHLRRQGT